MTDHITIHRALLKQALDALEAAKNGILWYGDTYPDATNDSDDEAMGKIDSALETLRAELAKPPTPAWHDAPTCAGLWLCDEGDDNPYRWTAHRVPWPLNPVLLGENERWLGPMPEDKP